MTSLRLPGAVPVRGDVSAAPALGKGCGEDGPGVAEGGVPGAAATVETVGAAGTRAVVSPGTPPDALGPGALESGALAESDEVGWADAVALIKPDASDAATASRGANPFEQAEFQKFVPTVAAPLLQKSGAEPIAARHGACITGASEWNGWGSLFLETVMECRTRLVGRRPDD